MEGDRTPLLMANVRGHQDILMCTPLFMASQKGHLHLVEYLLESGADINQAMNAGCSSLFLASNNGHQNIVRCLAEAGADLNQAMEDGSTLYIASVVREQGSNLNPLS